MVRGRRYLIEEKGAEVNRSDRNGRTPLHIAASWLGKFAKRRSSPGIVEYGPFRQIDLIQGLLAARAKVQKDNAGKTPLDLTDKLDAAEGLKLLVTPTLLSYSTASKPNSIMENEDLSAYWDKQIEKINELTVHLANKGIHIPLNELINDNPTNLVDTYNLTPAFINKLAQISSFSPLLEFRVKELEPLVNERMKHLNLLGKVTRSLR